jgi:cytoskeleton protein RodZ
MQSVGIRLREAREKKGFSLEEINARTRINPKNLVAIESDEVEKISSPFIYRSFVRQYASEVDLDFRALASGVDFFASQMRQPDLPGQGEHQVVRVAPLQARPKRDWTWVMPTAILLGVIGLGCGGYAYLKIYKPSELKNSVVSALFSKPTPATPTETKPPSPPVPDASTKTLVTVAPPSSRAATPATTHDPVAPSSPEADLTRSASVTPPPATASPLAPTIAAPLAPTPATDKIHLELAATERTWLSVTADGKTAYTGILEPLETKILEGQDTARLRTGNAGGVNIIFNGKAIGAIGPRGKTRTVIFSKTGYEIQPEGTTVSTNHIGG